ncbi:hypothetical protein [Enterobacter sp. ENT03]|uniref:ECs1072 family phage-associated protein n=1 Tax=Enterobacter sp. ENT03 TaxID=2854780 RepID=UPI001C476A70|nr:hypothetical protein [Enterobacter sp. ENT03]MBV7404599.1 hypothetical protein [Enterobacter sp. ENT03]
MQKFDELWSAIEKRVRENNDIPFAEMENDDSHLGNATRQRIAQIFILEVLLARHRDKYASVYVPLSGEEALYHLIFKRTGWKPFEIKQLSFNDAMFVIAELFREESLPVEAREMLLAQGVRDATFPVFDFSEKDWSPRENALFLQR